MAFAPTYPNCCSEFKFLLSPLEVLIKTPTYTLPRMSYQLCFFLKSPQNREEFCKLHYIVNIHLHGECALFGGLQLLYVFVCVHSKSLSGPLAGKLPICLLSRPLFLASVPSLLPMALICPCLLLNANKPAPPHFTDQ